MHTMPRRHHLADQCAASYGQRPWPRWGYPEPARYLQPDGRQLLLPAGRKRRDADQERAAAVPARVRGRDCCTAHQWPRQRQGCERYPASSGAAVGESEAAMATVIRSTILSRWTTDLVKKMPQIEGERYEIIDGELYVTTQPHFRHQATCDNIIIELGNWSRASSAGRTFQAPGIIFANDESVAPDIVWVRKDHLANFLGPDGKLHDAPD